MNKEEAKKYIAGRLELASRLDDPLTGNQKVALVRNLLATVDAIEIEHKPEVLPQYVGEWVDRCFLSMALSQLLDANYMPLAVKSWVYETRFLNQLTLMRACLYGWTPEKQFVLPMEETGDDLTNLYAVKGTQGDWDVRPANDDKGAVLNHYTVGQSDIDSAPAWVKAIKPVEAHYDKTDS
jgi:hypothetical protein